MKCDRHPDIDAIGSCAYCGRGVCEQCKVRVNEMLFCKECASAGRTDVGQAPPPRPAPDAPVRKASKLRLKRYVPRPIGPLRPALLKFGGAGGLLSGVMMMAMGVSIIILHSGKLPGGLLSVVLMLGMNALGLIFIAIGCYGIYWNYGTQYGIGGVYGILVMTILQIFVMGNMYRLRTAVDPLSILETSFAIFYSITYVLVHLSIAHTRHYIPKSHTARNVLVAARAVSIIGVGFLYTVLFFSFVGYLVVGVATILFGVFFLMAPMPEPSAQGGRPPFPAKTVPLPMMPPSPRG